MLAAVSRGDRRREGVSLGTTDTDLISTCITNVAEAAVADQHCER